MQEPFEILELRGDAIEPWLDALGTLRIRVFHDYPYLYDGSLEYEREYLRTYSGTEDSLVVLVVDPAGNPVGATTCLPLVAETADFLRPFKENGIDAAEVLYFGESILLSEWRGRGLGKTFFDLREAHAWKLGMKITTFCTVDRSETHPLRPPGYRPLDPFWHSRGYTKQPHLQATFTWKEIGEANESPKTLTFWTKTWDI